MEKRIVLASEATAERLVPNEMPRAELAAVNWVLCRVKEEILKGKPSGQVLDRALREVQDSATQPRQP